LRCTPNPQLSTKPYPCHALTSYTSFTQLSFLKIADTWFAFSFILLKRLREVKTALASMVISDFWSIWRKPTLNASKKMKHIVLDDCWWDREDLTA
jgi:hypothetical protein